MQDNGVTLDAGLLTWEVVQTIPEKGAHLGLLKRNHGEMMTAEACRVNAQLENTL